jgi:hypothetical protein
MAKTLLDEIEAGSLDSTAPLADTLRKCVILGGKAGSLSLREWATRELKGYEPDDEIPDYRKIAVPLMIDGFNGNRRIQRQQISSFEIPEFAQETINNTLPIVKGIGEVEAMIANASGSTVSLQHEHAPDVVRYMNSKNEAPFQHIERLYWDVSTTALRGIVDQVRTSLTELVAEMRAGTPRGTDLPSTAVAEQAVSVVVKGKRNRVHYAPMTASSGGTAIAGQNNTAVALGAGWSQRRKAVTVGTVVAVIGVLVSIAQWQGWQPF